MQEGLITPLRTRDVIEIPSAKPSLVIKVGKIDDGERQAFHVGEHLVTGAVADELR